jgi:hypothetical protein
MTFPEPWSYFILVLVGFLPNEIWRLLGVLASRGLNEDSEFVGWVRAVATALLAGVIAKILVFPPGALATISAPVRFGAVVVGFAVFVSARRSVFAGVAAGEVVLILGALWVGGQ